MNEKLLSIIVPTYNMELYLDRCLKSFLCVNKDKLEVYVVNDGSNDKSSQIAQSYVDKYPNIYKLINKTNGNYGSTINAALPLLCGKYVKIIDADDWIDTSNLESFLRVLREVDVDMLLTPYKYYFLDNSVKKSTIDYGLQYNLIVEYDSCINAFMKNMYTMHNVTYNTKVFRNLNYFQSEGISYTDQEWVFKPIVNLNKIMCVQLYLYCYFIGREGQTVSVSNQITHANDNYLGIKEMLSFKFQNIKNLSLPKIRIMDHMINVRCVQFYKIFLFFSKKNQIPNQLIRQIDKLVQSYPSLYNELINVSFPIFGKSIKKWLKKQEKPNKCLLYFLRLYRVFNKFN